jgi:diguanylate cyclase (GGDEF)-like protein/PAS domain S-box-containing protein
MIDYQADAVVPERGVEPAVRERRVSAILALGGIGVALGIGLCAIMAGVGGPNLIAWLSAGGVGMPPATGVGLVLAGGALVVWRVRHRRGQAAEVVVRLAAVAVGALGLAAFVHDVLGGGGALRDVLAWGPGRPVAPSLLGAVALVLSAAAMFLLAVGDGSSRARDVTAGLVFSIGLFGIMEQIVHGWIFELGSGSRFSLPSSIAFVALGVALELVDGAGLVAGRLQSVGPGGRLLRGAFPLILVGSLSVTAFTRLLSQRGIVSAEAADVLAIGTMITVVLGACWVLAGSLDRADDRLRSTEATLRTVTETVQDAFWVTSAKTGQLLYVSPGYERIWGRPAAELQADPASWLQAIHPDDRGHVVSRLAGVGEPDGFSEVWRVVRPDGETRWVRGRAWVVRDRSGTPVRLVGVGQDVTELKQAQLEREQSELRFHEVAERLEEGVWIATADAERVLYINPACGKIWGRAVDELAEHPSLFIQHVHPDDRDRVQKALESGALDETFRVLRPDGTIRWVHDRAFPIYNTSGGAHQIAGLARDITDHVQATGALELSRERYRHQALHDPLTGLANRPLFLDRVEHALSYRNEGELATVMLVDLDRFKSVNDTLGHAAGDDLLCQVARRLSECVRSEDTVARLGGDEFGVLISRPLVDVAEQVGNRIATRLSEPYTIANRSERDLSASVGLAVRSLKSDNPDSLIRHADLAMYHAKANGGGRSVRYREEMENDPRPSSTPRVESLVLPSGRSRQASLISPD